MSAEIKEVTEWNGKPHFMWVWNNNEEVKVKRYVLYILTDEECKRFCSYPVLTPDYNYLHCAEIEPEPRRRMTNYDLAKWLSEGANCGEFREWKKDEGDYEFINSHYSYFATDENLPCDDEIVIRSDRGKWHEPLVEVGE